jgi:hypothetical protein
MLAPMNGATARSPAWLTAYYAATPVFAYADWLGANVRVWGWLTIPSGGPGTTARAWESAR